MVEPRSEDENSKLEEMLVSGLETEYPAWNKIKSDLSHQLVWSDLCFL